MGFLFPLVFAFTTFTDQFLRHWWFRVGGKEPSDLAVFEIAAEKFAEQACCFRKEQFHWCTVLESDGAEPSPNSISLSNLLRLALIFDSVDWTAKAMKMFLVFSDRFERVPRAIPEMVSALMFHLQKPMQVGFCSTKLDGSPQL